MEQKYEELYEFKLALKHLKTMSDFVYEYQEDFIKEYKLEAYEIVDIVFTNSAMIVTYTVVFGHPEGAMATMTQPTIIEIDSKFDAWFIKVKQQEWLKIHSAGDNKYQYAFRIKLNGIRNYRVVRVIDTDKSKAFEQVRKYAIEKYHGQFNTMDLEAIQEVELELHMDAPLLVTKEEEA